jgi:hypothetical protein
MTRETDRDDRRPRAGSSAPPKNDPSDRPLTEDEKVDEAIYESFGTSDPPAYSGTTGVGAPKERKQTDRPAKKGN